MDEALKPASYPSPTHVPDTEELLAELWEARIVNPYASADRIRQHVLERCKDWEVSIKRVKKIMKDHSYLHTIPLIVPGSSQGGEQSDSIDSVDSALQKSMDKESLQLLLYELTKRENKFLDYVHDEAATMWMPTR
jgi:hypothetical protein